MKAAAAELEFEKAAMLRDQIVELRGQLQAIQDAADKRPAWEKIR
jgi:excinuclease UvrABC helicase subunit UvrB